jgi:hypothetical protein
LQLCDAEQILFEGDLMTMMMKSMAVLAVSLLCTASAAHATTIVQFSGNTNGDLATGEASITLDASGTFITGTLTNTSPFDARVTGFGFDIGPGNLGGYTGTPNPLALPAGVSFDFVDGSLGNVPQFSGAELDFGYLTGNNFAGGSPNDGLDTFQTLSFMISGSFAGLSEAEIATGLFTRFQRVGDLGELSDVAQGTEFGQLSPVPEPASMLLVGSGLVYLARRRYKSGPAPE